MAVSRTQRQLCGGHHTGLASLLNRCSSALQRQAASQRCNAHSSRGRTASGVSVAENRPSTHKALASRSQQRLTRRNSPGAAEPAAATELSAAIRACSSTAQLIDLYRLHGARFTAVHAYVALNRLVDVTAPPASDDGLELDPLASSDPDDDRPLQEQALGPSHHAPQMTGRLRVHQGQEFAQPPLHVDAASIAAAAPQRDEEEGENEEELDLLDERRGSNYGASTSGAPNASNQNLPVSQRIKRGGAQAQASEQQQQDERVTPANDWLPRQPSGPRSGASAAPQLPPPLPPRRAVVSMVSGLAAVLSHACHQLDGRGVAETARALSRLRYQDASLLRRLEQRAVKLMKGTCSSQSKSRGGGKAAVAWGRKGAGREARGGNGVANGSSSGSVNNSSRTGSGDSGCSTDPAAAAAAPDADGSENVAGALGRGRQQGRRGQVMDADDLYTMIAAFGAMGHRPSEAWRAAVIQATQPHLAAYAASPRGRLPLLLSSLGSFTGGGAASAAAPPAEWLRTACAASQPRLAACPPPQLRALAAGLAALRHHPGDAWLGEYLAAVERRMEEYSAWELVSTMASLASLRCSPGDGWMERFYGCTAAMVGTAGGLTGRLAAVLLSSLSQLKCRPAGDWLTLLLLGTRRSLGDASAAELTDMLAALARLRFRPPEAWLQQYFTASFQKLPFQTPEQCCAAAVALSALGRRPQPLWLGELGRHMGSKLALMPAGRQSSAVAALVGLGYVPTAGWLEAYEKQSNARLAESSPEELCKALDALAKVGFRPQASWLYAFILAVYSKLDSFNSAQLALVFDRLPALTPHGAWLDEIIQICAAETAMKAQMGVQQQQQQQEAAARALESQPELQRQQQPTPQGLAAERALLSVGQGMEAAVAEVSAASDAAPAGATQAVVAVSAAVSAQAEPTRAGAGAQEASAVTELAAAGLLAPDAADCSGGAAAAASCAAGVMDQPVREAAAAWGFATPLGTAAAPLNGTISISPELVPAAGDVLSVAAPYGGGRDLRDTVLSGAAGVAVGLGTGTGAGFGADDDDAAAAAAAAELLQRIPQEERLMIEPSAAAAAALAALTQDSNVAGVANSSGSRRGSSNGVRAERRSRGRGDGPGGGGDGGAPGGRGGGSSGSSWDDELVVDVGAGAGSYGNGRTPDVGLLQRPRVGRAPAAAVLASSSSAAAMTPVAAAAAASPAATQPMVAFNGGMGESWPGAGANELGLGLETAPVPTAAASVVTLQPKPRPLNTAFQPSAAGAPAATAAAGPGAAEAPAAGATPALPGGAAGVVAVEASQPLLPFGSAAGPAVPAAAPAAPTSAPASANDGCVQYLDSASLSRLIGAPDGPPGPDFSGCQKRAKEGRVAARRRGGGGPGPFQLGRVWNNDGGGGGGGGGGPLSGPVPSPSG